MQAYCDDLKDAKNSPAYNAYLQRIQKADALIVELTAAFVHQEMTDTYAGTKIQLKELKQLVKELLELKKPWWRQWAEAIIITGSLIFVLKTFVFGTYYVPSGSAEHTILVGDRIWANKLAYYYDKIQYGDCVIFDEPRFVYDTQNSINRMWQKYIGLPIPLLGLSEGPVNVIKRVIACPGDYIEGRSEDGKAVLYRNDVKIEEPYLNEFPLILARRSSGFIDLGPLAQFPIISWFNYQQHHPVFYSYDPRRSLSNQQFYCFAPHEIVIHPQTQKPIFKQPYYAEPQDVFPRMQLPPGKYWVMGDSRKNSGDSRVFGFLDESLICGRALFIMYSVDSVEAFWPLELLKHPLEFFTHRVRWSRFFKFFHNPVKMLKS